MIAEVRNENVGGKRGRGYPNVSKSRTSILVGVGLSVLIHAIGLWLLSDRAPLAVKTMSSNAETRMTVSLAPPMPPPPAQQKMPEPAVPKTQKKSPPSSTNRKYIKKKIIKIDRVPADASKTTPSARQSDTKQRKLSAPEDDMFTQVEAARKRRADARAQADTSELESAPSMPERAQNDNSIALANIATSLNHARGERKADAGGVFQVRQLGYRNAEFLFRGWSMSSRRNATRLVTVEQGTDADIQTAIVKKMIDIIREQRPGNFIWESYRLGKQITLSAKPQDSAELQQFLLKEFFPDYLPASSRR